MNTPNDGGPAFPKLAYLDAPDGTGTCLIVQESDGLSSRDWFAGMALQGLATTQEMLLSNNELLAHFGTDGIDRLQANKAYRLADAMLAERAKNLQK